MIWIQKITFHTYICFLFVVSEKVTDNVLGISIQKNHEFVPTNFKIGKFYVFMCGLKQKDR